MSFTKPALFTEIDPTNYESEHNQNYVAIDSAFSSIQNELLILSGSSPASPASNLVWVNNNLQTDSPIGFDSWVPIFTANTDGFFTLTLGHQTPTGISYAVIGQLIHSSSAIVSFDIDTIAPAGDGPHRMVIGLTSAGSPAVNQLCVANEFPTDDPVLALFVFEYHRTTDGPRIYNLRRLTSWLMNSSSWIEVRDRVTTMQTSIEKVDSTKWPDAEGDTDGVFLIPFDCEVVGAAAYINQAPNDPEAIEVTLVRNGHADGVSAEKVHAGSWKWGDDTDALTVRANHELGTVSPSAQLLMGDYVNIRLNTAASVSTDNEDIVLECQLRIRPIEHDPRKAPV